MGSVMSDGSLLIQLHYGLYAFCHLSILLNTFLLNIHSSVYLKYGLHGLLMTVCVLPQLAISEHFTVNLHKSLMGAPGFNFAHHRQLWQHAVI
jgi:hypothetical protein